jgi:hypothetical protein
LSLGLPVIAPLQSEIASLTSNKCVGLRYGTNTGQTLVQCIEQLLENHLLQQTMTDNIIKLDKETLSFDKVYGGLISHLEILTLTRI